jgi:hypothetical protein
LQTGYEGARCATCSDGYFLSNGSCVPCPSSPFASIIIFVLAALGACALSYGLTKSGLDLPLLTIGIDYAQVVAVFASTNVTWPAQILSLYKVLSAFNLNLDLAAPECAIKTISYVGKWVFIEMLPVAAFVIFGVVYVLHLLYKRLFTSKRSAALHTHLPALVSVSIVMFRTLYLYLTKVRSRANFILFSTRLHPSSTLGSLPLQTTFEIFNCVPTTPPDGKQYMVCVSRGCASAVPTVVNTPIMAFLLCV